MTIAVQGPRIAGAVLEPDEAQATFRVVLDALARPGAVHQLPAAPRRRVPAALLPVLALADLGTPVCLLDHGDGRWADVLATVTSAPVVGLTAARLVAALRALRPDEFVALSRGGAAAPEDGALVTVSVPDVDAGGRPLLLSGPGIDGQVRVAPSGLSPALIAARADAVAGFPAGVDVLLVDRDGRLLGLPRSTRIAED
ncbi:MAG: phosphonate C-P lyase system protein PhnH [Pseudonocardiaceae bacterium]